MSKGSRAVALGANSSAQARDSVALGAGSEAVREQSVSVGREGHERQITHVAAATQGTDAVNLDQLHDVTQQASERALQQANAYTDQKIRTLRDDAFAGIASAMAMAALPAPSVAGESMVTMGAAHFGSQQALAVGVSGRSDEGRWTYKASGSTDSQHHLGVAVGVGYSWR